MDWDDLKVFSAVAQHGSVRAAARSLRVHASTVSRRLEHLEQRTGARLFNRSGRQLALTQVGALAAEGLHRIESEMRLIEQSLRQDEAVLSGWVRVLVPEYLLQSGLSQSLADFAERHSEVRVECVGAAAPDALPDLVLMSAQTPPLDMIARQVASIAWTIFRRPRRAPGAQGVEPWIEHGASPAPHLVDDLKQRYMADAETVTRCESLAHLMSMIRAGVGASVLPCALGDPDPELVRSPGVETVAEPLWLLLAPGGRSIRRVRLLAECLTRDLRGMERLLVGEGRL